VEIVRKIIHIDMDAFFASVEQRDFPELKGKPVAVGGSADRGVVAAASYEARKFGVKSALPSKTAKKLCPELIFVKPRFDIYKQVSLEIREIFAEYTDLIEPLSLDEAYLDVTENHKGMKIATDIATDIRKKIWEKTNLTASAGISYNKFLAKMASDINKPNGQFVIKPAQAEAFVEALPIHKFYGIGKVTSEKMKSMGIFTGKDLKEKSLAFLSKHFGKLGNYYFEIAQGKDNRMVTPNRESKSVGVENTFENDLADPVVLRKELMDILEQLQKRIARKMVIGRTLTLKIKFSDFEIISKSKTFEGGLTDFDGLKRAALHLFEQVWPLPKGVRLMGLSVSNFESNDSGKQLRLEI
jgi:DNA polymerase IV